MNNSKKGLPADPKSEINQMDDKLLKQGLRSANRNRILKKFQDWDGEIERQNKRRKPYLMKEPLKKY